MDASPDPGVAKRNVITKRTDHGGTGTVIYVRAAFTSRETSVKQKAFLTVASAFATVSLMAACSNSSSTSAPSVSGTPAVSSTTGAPSPSTTTASASTTTASASTTALTGVGKIGVSIPLLTTDFWRQFNTAVESEIKAKNLDALAIVNAGGDSAKQLSDIDALVTQGAKGIILSPVDSGAITAKLNDLKSKGIKVVVVNDGVAAPVGIVVRANNLDYGKLACDAMSKVITSGSIIHIAGDPTNVAAQERAKGFDDCMKEKAPGVKMVRIDAKGWAASEAADKLPALLGANKDVKGVYMHAGGAFLAPTMTALKAKNMLVKAGQPGHIYLASIDGIPDEFKAIQDGYEDYVIAQPVALYGQFGVDYMASILAGTDPKEGTTDHKTTIVKDANGNLQDVLQPLLVSKDNVADFVK